MGFLRTAQEANLKRIQGQFWQYLYHHE